MSEPPTIDDHDLVLRTIALTAERASAVRRGISTAPDLPHPIRTDANLGHYLDLATSAQGHRSKPSGDGWGGPPAPKGVVDRLRSGLISKIGRRLGWADQASYNDAIVNALHQLDHRTQLQAHRITRLEAELAEARRAIADHS